MLQEFQPMASQLSKKAAPHWLKILRHVAITLVIQDPVLNLWFMANIHLPQFSVYCCQVKPYKVYMFVWPAEHKGLGLVIVWSWVKPKLFLLFWATNCICLVFPGAVKARAGTGDPSGGWKIWPATRKKVQFSYLNRQDILSVGLMQWRQELFGCNIYWIASMFLFCYASLSQLR